MPETTAIKERPLLYSSAMVRALLSGVKTQTRRVVHDAKPWTKRWYLDGGGSWRWMPSGPSPSGTGGISGHWRPCPYGKPGDRLWVRESWNLAQLDSDPDTHHVTVSGIWIGPIPKAKPYGWDVIYAADDCWNDDRHFGWRPSIHMPRWASRITLEITDVRIERVQSITPEDALAEGVAELTGGRTDFDPVKEFARLWETINGDRDGGRYRWERNPWVWKVAFRRLEGSHATS